MSEIEARASRRICFHWSFLAAVICYFSLPQILDKRLDPIVLPVAILFGSMCYLGSLRFNMAGWRSHSALRQPARPDHHAPPPPVGGLAFWNFMIRVLACIAALQVASPAIDRLISGLGELSAAWWAAKIALLSQFTVLWVLACTGVRAALRRTQPDTEHEPLWRGAVIDFGIALGFILAGILGYLAIQLLLAASFAAGTDEVVAWIVIAFGGIVLFQAVRDGWSTRHRRVFPKPPEPRRTVRAHWEHL